MGIREGLQHASDRKLLKIIPHVKKNRKEAIRHYDGLLWKMETKLHELSGKMLAREDKGVTGLGSNYLLVILEYLQSGNSKDWIKIQLNVSVGAASVNLEKESSDWYKLLRKINQSIERINIEFGRPI